MIQVLMIGRATLFSHPGGDTMQITKTAEYLNKTNKVLVDIKTVENEIDYSKYNLIHLFNICRPADLLGTIKKANKPYIVSTIFVDFSEAEKNHYKFHRRFFFRLLKNDKLEYLKASIRILKGQDKLTDNSYLFKGQKKSIIEIIKGAELLLPNSKSEYNRLFKTYKVAQDYRVIPNAIDLDIFSSEKSKDEKFNKFDDSIVSVGQITPVKNQLLIIQALNNIKQDVFIIGSPASNSLAYYNECKKIAAKNIHFISHLSQAELAEIFKRAKVHVLASWFETTGLVSLEAAYSGCNIVISNRGDQMEYFKDDVFYCEPSQISSITKAVDSAYISAFNVNLKNRIETDYNWEKAAQETLKAYCFVLDKLKEG
ncbi:glycosyltransferase family 4 protein [Xanthomarina gelatinilytica]|uniref:glycosyltransferase family 4 protein n=1 Tax=Xanthomarina gelatinilytica TaxID=1137281 RepID=UPI003AA9612A